jgi:ribosomal protein S18 acetylase RimI-like enzyme
MALTYDWRGFFDNAEVNALHAEAFGHRPRDDDWRGQLRKHSLGWVCARDDHKLIGFVNVAWDGGIHAFILDPVVATEERGRGVGTRLIAVAVSGARDGGCDWLHVDFDDHLQPFYFDACGFAPTKAGLIRL